MPRLVIDTSGNRHDYACDPKPCGAGGYATVFAATHKPTGIQVAFKRLNVNFDEHAQLRMKREVQTLRKLAPHRHVMPILDWAENFRWYVMPLAVGDMTKFRVPMADRDLVQLLDQVSQGLAHAHQHRYVNRDVKPPNILWLDADDDFPARWVVADWGLVRNPPGMTTKLLTKSGQVIGTEGFIAPEILKGAHEHATAKADVDSLGRVAYWATTGLEPLAGEQALPVGPFRQLVRAATAAEPERRISLDRFRELLGLLNLEPPPPPVERAERLRDQAQAGDIEAGEELFDLADEHLDDADLFLDHVARVPRAVVSELVSRDPDRAGRLVEAMKDHLRDNFGDRNFQYLNTPLRWIEFVARAAVAINDLGLLEDTAMCLFEADGSCARFDQRRRTRALLESLSGSSARTVARALQANERAVEWYTDEEWVPSRRSDPAIRGALLQHQT